MKAGCSALAGFVGLVVLLLGVALAGAMQGEDAPQSGAPGGLNPESVPAWAVPLLQRAAGTCPEVTAPVLAAQIQQESAWNPNASSSAGAVGLTQFMPATWSSSGTDGDGDGRADPRNPSDAVQSQAKYMCGQVQQVRGGQLPGDVLDLALAAYNAGFGAVKKAQGIPPYPETQHYVRTIRGLIGRYSAPAGQQIAPANGGAAAAVAAAHEVEGTRYAWGGGSTTGPSEGVGIDQGVRGFDCSSLVRYAYYRGTGGQLTLPRTTTTQFSATQGQPVDPHALVPGDLLFYGKPGNMHHVAIAAGGGQMIEAPQSGQTVHTTPVRLGGDFHAATRPLP